MIPGILVGSLPCSHIILHWMRYSRNEQGHIRKGYQQKWQSRVSSWHPNGCSVGALVIVQQIIWCHQIVICFPLTIYYEILGLQINNMVEQSLITESESRHCHDQEHTSRCQQLIRDSFRWIENVAGHDYKTSCMFGDILGLLPHGTLTSDTMTYTQKYHAIMNCNLVPQMHCLQHSAEAKGCPCDPHKATTFSVSGLPCPDMSVANSKRLKRAGPTNSVYITHGKWATTNRIPLLLIECTPDSRPYKNFFWFFFGGGCVKSCA